MTDVATGRAIGEGMRVTLHFSIGLDDGTEIDSTRRGRPATFVVGDGNLLPGFEAALFGLRGGAEARLLLEPEQAFGLPNPDNIQRHARARFGEMAVDPGTVVSFADAAGTELCGVVSALEGEDVIVDFNHPLAGRPIVFEVSILRVEDYLIR